VGGARLRHSDDRFPLTGFWGERVRRAALWLIERNAVHVLATDAHDTEGSVRYFLLHAKLPLQFVG